jgi:shikimate kinase
MYSGKSSVATQLAQLVKHPAIEMDDLILKKSGRDSIVDIFAIDGEKAFRAFETQVADEIRGVEDAIISTGGGVGINAAIVDTLHENGTVIFLEASFETILERAGNDDTRPLMQDKVAAKILYQERLPHYRKNADITISTDNKTIEEIADEIQNEHK